MVLGTLWKFMINSSLICMFDEFILLKSVSKMFCDSGSFSGMFTVLKP